MKSVMRHLFSEVPRVDIPRSTFDRSHGLKTTFDAGYLIPILVDEALPGDTFTVNMTGFARLSTPIYPIMDNLRMETFFFAVPNRLVWENWTKFCGERLTPNASIDYTIPYRTINNAANETIDDYFGLPTKIAANYNVSALPYRAYRLIWSEWFRDQNLQNYETVDITDGQDVTAYAIKRRGKRHDYFTSCLPWLQKGDAVQLSLGTDAPVIGLGMGNTTYTVAPANVRESGTFTGTVQYDAYKVINPGSADGEVYVERNPSETSYPWIRADLENATAGTVNELRQAIQVQRILERDSRSGTRYCEVVQSQFGVNSPSMAVLQRPEYLGGGSTPVHITPIAQTDTTVGKLAAIGTVAFSGHGFTKSFTEHCIIIGLVNVRADLTYQEGIDRMWSRSTRYDFYWPSLAHLGEQAVLNQEIYIDAATIGAGTNDDVFGYQERFAEYRYKPSKVTGKFRSNDAATLDAWHLSTEFGATPTLGDTFIQDDPPIDRVIATPTEPHFIFDSYFSMKCVRPMPVYSVPGLIDHF